ncbi:Uncharacterized protein LW94_12716 [Fusarium fujikuroi]|nr:Uncharacterized protein LW94_12716 [Fusarium fujikuroi]
MAWGHRSDSVCLLPAGCPMQLILFKQLQPHPPCHFINTGVINGRGRLNTSFITVVASAPDIANHAEKQDCRPQRKATANVCTQPVLGLVQVTVYADPTAYRRTRLYVHPSVPVDEIRGQLQVVNHGHEVTIDAAIFLAAALEFIAAEAVELAGRAAQDDRAKRIEPHHVRVALCLDRDLKELVRDAIIT